MTSHLLSRSDCLLALDSGTQSVRALLFDLEGQLLAKSRVRFEPYRAEQPGWAEYPAEAYWTALGQACQQLWAQEGVRKEALRGVAVTTQRGTVINVDRHGTPLRPAILWLDRRRTEGIPPPGGLWGNLLRWTPRHKLTRRVQAEAEVNWIRRHQPEIWEKTHKFLLLSGYLSYQLTGRFADSVACQVGYLPFDYQRQTWAEPGSWRCQAIPVEPERLPELQPVGTVLGAITPQASQQTGIPAGLPLLAAAADRACEVLGSGGIEATVGCLGYGTAATLNLTVPRYVEVVAHAPAFPAALPGAFNVEFQVSRGFWLVEWFKEQFGQPERAWAAEHGGAVEPLLDALAAQVPPGSLGLILQPYWSPGVRFPGPEAKGAILGFGEAHGRAHIYRAILEGIAYALRDGKDRAERRCGVRLEELRVAGGGSQSDVALQITADVLGLPTARPHVFETTGLGAAIDAAVGLKLHNSFPAAVQAMTRVSRVFEPQPQAAALYDLLYQRVYRRLYPRLQPFYQTIRDVTGYPSR